MVKALFVYEDGTMQERDVETAPATVKLMRHQTVSGYADNPDVSLPKVTITFTRAGHLYDKRPVYCAPGITVDEAYISEVIPLKLTKLEIELVDVENRDTLRRVVAADKVDGVVELGGWRGSVNETDLATAGLVRRFARITVAIPPVGGFTIARVQ